MNDTLKIIISVYFLIMNLAGFLSMEFDKRKAIKHQWRVPEKVLFLLAILGGSIGSTTGMYVFHHKTKHWYFALGMPAILIIQILIGILLKVYILK